MIKIDNITDVEGCLDGIKAVIFDLDDTLFSEKDYVKSGFRAACPQKAEELWNAFLAGERPFDTVIPPEEKENALINYRTHFPDIKLYLGVKEMLLKFRSDGKKLGIITDGRPEGQRAKLAALKIEQLFDEIIITDDLGGIEYRKPNDKAFCIMQERFNVPFQKMAYIGDNPKKDFIAPQKLGMKCIWFQNPDGLYK